MKPDTLKGLTTLVRPKLATVNFDAIERTFLQADTVEDLRKLFQEKKKASLELMQVNYRNAPDDFQHDWQRIHAAIVDLFTSRVAELR